jgi:hypothetical protein
LKRFFSSVASWYSRPLGFIFHIQPPEQFGHVQLGGVDEGLFLTCGDRRLYHGAVGVDDGVARILPALVFGALGRAGQVFVKTVAIEISPFIFPNSADGCQSSWTRSSRYALCRPSELSFCPAFVRFRFQGRLNEGTDPIFISGPVP